MRATMMDKIPASEAQGHTATEHNGYHGLYECSGLCSFVLLFSPHHILMQLYQYFQWEKVSVFLSNQVTTELL